MEKREVCVETLYAVCMFAWLDRTLFPKKSSIQLNRHIARAIQWTGTQNENAQYEQARDHVAQAHENCMFIGNCFRDRPTRHRSLQVCLCYLSSLGLQRSCKPESERSTKTSLQLRNINEPCVHSQQFWLLRWNAATESKSLRVLLSSPVDASVWTPRCVWRWKRLWNCE